jgi:hypothetical protein
MANPSATQLTIVGTVLLLFLTGVSLAGAQSLRSRDKGPRVSAWLVELWGYATGLAVLVWLSGRVVDYDFWLGWANVRDGRLSATAYGLAVIGMVAGFGFGFRTMALVREGIGQFVAAEPDAEQPDADHAPDGGSEDGEEQGSEGSADNGR